MLMRSMTRLQMGLVCVLTAGCASAQRAGAFLSVTTYATNDTTLPWTHMRVSPR
jgi:hypothetical protein